MLLEIKNIVAEPEKDINWELPAIPDRLKPRCLSDLIKEIPEFQKALLPNSRWAITQINRALKNNQFIEPSRETKKRNLYSNVALAIDRGAILLRGQIKNELLIQRLQQYDDYGKKLATIIEKFEPIAQDSIFSRETAGYLFLLGKLEPIFRGFRPISDIKALGLPSQFKRTTIEKWLTEIVSDEVSEEILDLLICLDKLRLPGQFHDNPIFGGIGPVLGSDGDWITGDTLVELKCTVRGMKREYVVQVVCYAALSKIGSKTSTIPPINKIAICFPRQSSVIVGSIEDWLRVFGAPSPEIVFKSIENYFSSYKL